MNGMMKTVAGLGLVLAWGTGQADVITAAIVNDARVFDNSVPKDGVANGVNNDTAVQIGVGDNELNAVASLIYVVQLPTLPAGEAVSDVNLSVYLKAISNNSNLTMPNMQVDVFFKNSAAVEISDYSVTGSVAVASIQNFINPGSTVEQYYTWSDAALVNAFADIYDGSSAPSATHAVFRLRWPGANIIFPVGNLDNDFYMMSTSEASSNAPSVTITTIPEPATLGLFIVASGSILLARRRACANR